MPNLQSEYEETMKLFIDQIFTGTHLDHFEETYFSEEFNTAIAREIGLKERKLVDKRVDDDGKVHRRVRMVPAIELPGPIRKIVGDREISYDEVSVFDPSTHSVRYQIESAAQDRVSVGGEIQFTEESGSGVRRVIDGEIQVKVFGLGTVIERFIESETQKSYARISNFMQTWLDEHPPAAD